jgi:hypothetical protein
MPAVDPEAVTNAVLSQLIDESPGFLIGDGKKPDGIPLTNQKLPAEWYGILYPVDPADADGALGDDTQWQFLQYQVTVVGGVRAQAENGQKKVRDRLVGWTPTVAGVGFEPMQLFDRSGVERDDDVNPPVFFTTDRFVVFAS